MAWTALPGAGRQRAGDGERLNPNGWEGRLMGRPYEHLFQARHSVPGSRLDPSRPVVRGLAYKTVRVEGVTTEHMCTSDKKGYQ